MLNTLDLRQIHSVPGNYDNSFRVTELAGESPELIISQFSYSENLISIHALSTDTLLSDGMTTISATPDSRPTRDRHPQVPVAVTADGSIIVCCPRQIYIYSRTGQLLKKLNSSEIQDCYLSSEDLTTVDNDYIRIHRRVGTSHTTDMFNSPAVNNVLAISYYKLSEELKMD
jgi:hypothetical protein